MEVFKYQTSKKDSMANMHWRGAWFQTFTDSNWFSFQRFDFPEPHLIVIILQDLHGFKPAKLSPQTYKLYVCTLHYKDFHAVIEIFK